MQNFTYYAPTQVVFGKNTESQVGELVKKYGGTKVLVHFGGGSVIDSVKAISKGVPNDYNDVKGTALRGIEKMEDFYRSIGMPTNIHDLIGKDITDAEIEEMADKCSNNGTTTAGCLKVLTREDMINIYKMAR